MKISRIILVLLAAFFVTNTSFSQSIKETQASYEREYLEAQKKYEAGLISTKTYKSIVEKLGQKQNTRFELNRKIILNTKDKKAKNITLKIDKKTVMFALEINCRVGSGNLTIEIYDPKGIKQGEFSVESQMDETSKNKYEKGIISAETYMRESVEGNISKQITNPVTGNWIVKLIPDNVMANISIQSQFINK